MAKAPAKKASGGRAGKVLRTTGKIATLVAMPAAVVARDAIRDRKQITSSLSQLAAGAMRGEGRAIAGLGAKVAKSVPGIATFALPAFAAGAAVAMYDQSRRRGDDVVAATGEAALEAGDFIAGRFGTNYNKNRKAGQTMAEAGGRAALQAVDNRLLLGMGSVAVDKVLEYVNSGGEKYSVAKGENKVNPYAVPSSDTASQIAEMPDPEPFAKGSKTASKADKSQTGSKANKPSRLSDAEKQKFKEASKTKQSAATKKPKKPAGEDKPKGEGPRGFTPEARISAYYARNPSGTNAPYGGDPSKAEDWKSPKEKVASK